MYRLNVVRMVVSPRPSHAFGLDMVGHNLVVIRESCVADCAFPVLLDDLSVQQLPHLCWRPELAISPGVVWIFDALNTKLKSAFFPGLLATAAEERFVKRAIFIPTEFHGNAPVCVVLICIRWPGGWRRYKHPQRTVPPSPQLP
jgi:hypothetical protein